MRRWMWIQLEDGVVSYVALRVATFTTLVAVAVAAGAVIAYLSN